MRPNGFCTSYLTRLYKTKLSLMGCIHLIIILFMSKADQTINLPYSRQRYLGFLYIRVELTKTHYHKIKHTSEHNYMVSDFPPSHFYSGRPKMGNYETPNLKDANSN